MTMTSRSDMTPLQRAVAILAILALVLVGVMACKGGWRYERHGSRSCTLPPCGDVDVPAMGDDDDDNVPCRPAQDGRTTTKEEE